MKSNVKRAQQRQRLIAALLQQPTVEKAAAEAGMSTVTAWRIRQSAEFEEEFRQARQQAFAQAQARAQYASNNALSVLLRIMMEPTNPAPARVRAAAEVMSYGKTASVKDEQDASRNATKKTKRVELSRLSNEQLAQARQLALAAKEPHVE